MFFVRCLIAKVWTRSGSKSLAFFSLVSKNKLFSQNLQMLSDTPLFWWFRWIKHLKTLWKMLGNMKFGSLVLKLWSQTMLWTRVPFREYLRHTRATSFQTNENLGLYSFFHGLSTLKQCDFNQKTSILGAWFTSYAPKHPNFAGLGQKWDWPITSQETTFWVMCVLFMD